MIEVDSKLAKQKIKLVATDLDNTLLDSNFAVREDVRQMANRLVEDGVRLVLVSGRMHKAAAGIAQRLGLDLPIISYNGACIKKGLSGKIMFESFLDHDLAVEITKIGMDLQLTTQLYVGEDYYVAELTPYAKFYAEANRVDQIVEPDLLGVLSLGDTYKILFIGEDEALAKAKARLDAKFKGKIYLTTSHANFLESLPLNANKGLALQKVAAMWGIEKQEIMALGDNYNDLPLLASAGVAVAMGNAVAGLKVEADYVTKTTDEGGWVAAIEKFVY